MCRVFSCVVGRGCLLSLGKSLLVFALLHFVLQGQTCLLFQVSLDFLLLHSRPQWWKGHLFRVLVLEDLVGLHRTIQLQLQHYWSGQKKASLFGIISRRSLFLEWSNQSILKENQSWIFIRRTNADPETPILWPPDAKNWLTGKDPDAAQDWKQEEKGTEDEIIGWHHWLNGHEFEQAPGVGDGQGSLPCCSSWGGKESDMTEQLNNWTDWTD